MSAQVHGGRQPWIGPSKTISQNRSLCLVAPDRHCSDGGTKVTNLLNKATLSQGEDTKNNTPGSSALSAYRTKLPPSRSSTRILTNVEGQEIQMSDALRGKTKTKTICGASSQDTNKDFTTG